MREFRAESKFSDGLPVPIMWGELMVIPTRVGSPEWSVCKPGQIFSECSRPDVQALLDFSAVCIDEQIAARYRARCRDGPAPFPYEAADD